jgi:glycosyltransferase involved in cell wall biosynthesis
MKYLFINSVAGFGSTGRIAAEKCRELMAEGHECVLAFGREKANCDDLTTWQIGSPLDYKIHGFMTRVFDNHGFSSAAATRAFLKRVEEYDPDVIWLHNLHGYYIHIGLLFDYLRGCGKKILWTLHDCWSFTGHCAYFDFVGCDRWKTGCHDCPQKKNYPASKVLDNSRKNYENKKRSFTGVPNMTLLTPSQWLAGRVQNSFLREYPVEVVYNTVNTDIFKPTPSDFRQKHGLEHHKIVLGVASVWEERKGLKDFVKLASMLDENYKIVLVGLSEEDRKQIPESILGLPRTNSARELAQIYSAADVYVNPSVEETFGMTTVEALCCGTTAVVYQDTACEEVVNQFGGIAVPRGVEHLMKAICEA